MADSAEKKKRKRDVKDGLDEGADEARITYHTPFKTFERLFNEASLDDTKRVVRAKLGLEPTVGVKLAQLRGDSKIVLEDEDDFRAFCVTLRANPQVDVQVTVAGLAHVQEKEIIAPASKKRKTKQSTVPTPNANGDASVTSGGVYTTPANLAYQPFTTFSTSSIASVPPSTSPSKSTSPATITSPLLSFPSISAPFTTPVPAPVSLPVPAAIRALPPATGVLGLTPTEVGKAVAKRKGGDKGKEKVESEEDDTDGKKEEEKEKPKRVRKKSEAATAPVAPMSPAAREKAAAILERHRKSMAEKAKAPRKRTKKGESEVKESTTASKKAVEESPADGGKEVEQADESDKAKQDKKKKKKKHGAEDGDRDDAQREEDARHEEQDWRHGEGHKTAREEIPVKPTREESPKKARKRKEKDKGSPVRASVPSGTLEVEHDAAVGMGVCEKIDVVGGKDIPVMKGIGKGKLKMAAPNAKAGLLITRPANSAEILNAKKGDKMGGTTVTPVAVVAATEPTKNAPYTLSAKQATSAKSPTPPTNGPASSVTKETNKSKKKPSTPAQLCQICLAPFHLRFKCPLLHDRGQAIEKRLEELQKAGQTQLFGEIQGWLEAERKRDRLRALTKPVVSGAMRRNGHGGVAVKVAKVGLKRARQGEESDQEEEKEVKNDVLGDPNATEDEEEDNDDVGEEEDEWEDSIRAYLGRPPTSKPSLVSVQKPGEGSETTSSNSSEEGEDVESVPNEDQDAEMQDASRGSTPHDPSTKPGDKHSMTNSSITRSSSSCVDSPSPTSKRPTDSAQSQLAKLESAARTPQSFRGINDVTAGGATDAVHRRLQRDTAQVLVLNSDDSGDEEMVDADAENEQRTHTPDAPGSGSRLFQRLGSPVAKGRPPGTPSRIQVMKDRHGNTAPVQRSYGNDGVDGDERARSPPGALPFPNHKLQSASQSTALPSRMSLMPRLSNFTMAGLSNIFKSGGAAASSPIAPGTPKLISIAPSGTPLPGDKRNDFPEESTSSSSADSDSDIAPRVPKSQRAGASLAMPHKKSVLATL